MILLLVTFFTFKLQTVCHLSPASWKMGDCCIPIIIICGSRSFIRRKKAPPQLAPYLDQTFFCHYCRCYRPPAVFKRNDWFTLCFIPIFPCHLGNKYLGCDVCKRPLDPHDLAKKCHTCGCNMDHNARFCATCGNEQ